MMKLRVAVRTVTYFCSALKCSTSLQGNALGAAPVLDEQRLAFGQGGDGGGRAGALQALHQPAPAAGVRAARVW